MVSVQQVRDYFPVLLRHEGDVLFDLLSFVILRNRRPELLTANRKSIVC